MIYVMSGTYGDEEKYFEMLKKLNLSDENDSLFVLGNIIGYGKDGIKILCDMMYRPNVFPILGLQEYYAREIFPEISDVSSPDECLSVLSDEKKDLFGAWLKHGGYPAVGAFLSLEAEERESVVDFLSEFAPFEELEVSGKNFVLAFAGVRNFEEGKALETYDEADFVLKTADYSKVYFSDKFLITASLPTEKIPGAKAGKVYSGKKHLALNCSTGNSVRLCAVCLDTMKVYYC